MVSWNASRLSRWWELTDRRNSSMWYCFDFPASFQSTWFYDLYSGLPLISISTGYLRNFILTYWITIVESECVIMKSSEKPTSYLKYLLAVFPLPLQHPNRPRFNLNVRISNLPVHAWMRKELTCAKMEFSANCATQIVPMYYGHHPPYTLFM